MQTIFMEKQKKTLPKTCILSVHDHVTDKDVEIHGKNHVCETKGHYEKRLFRVFLSFFSTKKLKLTNNNTHYREKNK